MVFLEKKTKAPGRVALVVVGLRWLLIRYFLGMSHRISWVAVRPSVIVGLQWCWFLKRKQLDMKIENEKNPRWGVIPRESRHTPALVDIHLCWQLFALKGVRSSKERKNQREVVPRGSPCAPALVVVSIQLLLLAFHGDRWCWILKRNN